MPGSYATNHSTVEFALDYTEYLPSNQNAAPKYFLQILCAPYGKSMGTGKIEHLSVIDYTDVSHPKEYICRNLGQQELKRGGNLFAIPARYWGNYSSNPVSWQQDATTASSKTFIVRILYLSQAEILLLPLIAGNNHETDIVLCLILST